MCCGACYAQSDRYELGKRVRRFELAWQAADADRRAASATPMQQAVKSFFTMQFASAARELDNAYFIVRQATSPTIFEQAALAQRMEVQPVAIDSMAAACQIKLLPYYKMKLTDDGADGAAALEAAQVKLTLVDSHNQSHAHFDLAWKSVVAGTELKFKEVPEGDYWLQASLELLDQKIPLPPTQVSLVRDLDDRLRKLEEWLKAERSAAQRTDALETVRLTVRQYAQTIRSQVDGRALETDYPTWRLLTLSEELVAAPDRAVELLREQARQSIWLTLSHKRQSLPVRVQMPTHSASDSTVDSSPLPVLIAFHGAGGSENMFFETYGAGRLVAMASQRSWIVVTPRHPLLGMPMTYREIIEVLSHFYPIDSRRVYLVGHSMGAAEVVRQVSLASEPPQAAVAVGGGGSAKDIDAYRETPWFVAAGELDFGRSGAKSLAERLEQFKCRVEYREYPDVEHMVIMQAAIDDIFAFLDRP